MIVCHCHARSDRDIRKAAERGARCVEDVERVCRAGDDCGGCRPRLELILQGLRAKARSRAAAG